MVDAVGVTALILVIIVIVILIFGFIWFFVAPPGELGVTGFTGTGSDTINNLGNKLILYQPQGTVTGTPVITLGSNGNNTTGKTFIIRNNSNLNSSSNTVAIQGGGTLITNLPSGNTKLNLSTGTSAWFVFNKQNQATLIGVVPNGSFSTS